MPIPTSIYKKARIRRPARDETAAFKAGQGQVDPCGDRSQTGEETSGRCDAPNEAEGSRTGQAPIVPTVAYPATVGNVSGAPNGHPERAKPGTSLQADKTDIDGHGLANAGALATRGGVDTAGPGHPSAATRYASLASIDACHKNPGTGERLKGIQNGLLVIKASLTS